MELKLCSTIEVTGLTDAVKLLSRLESDVAYCYPVWQKVYHAKEYLKTRQGEIMASSLADPEKEAA